MAQIDLNADLGEGGDLDEALMSVVTSCNIACGGHAGDDASMRAALRLAKQNQVSPGAHPSFPDRENFGRAASSLSGPALVAELTSQLTALNQIAVDEGLTLSHLKPHGALYNMAAKDPELADQITEALLAVIPTASLVGPPNSELKRAAAAQQIEFVAEGFADRAYEADGQLRQRSLSGAVIHDADAQTKQALQIATEKQVTSFDGARLDLPAETLCVHGDTPAAFDAARKIKAAFEQSGISICAPY